eukprot:CAMPEP_0170599028 /NCGR_PEP_ID=MMETSP0224-20130122/16568_1 /TAXON_ID=285029 /ORGANISM="Togula jolla, Strain CCCM 725" /LENGTH=34 /DNA_ID= /DNA_START= /DNA_END= /DNA_ORIENTATION=
MSDDEDIRAEPVQEEEEKVTDLKSAIRGVLKHAL